MTFTCHSGADKSICHLERKSHTHNERSEHNALHHENEKFYLYVRMRATINALYIYDEQVEDS